MKHFIYLDESGEVSFSKRSAYDFFVICALSISEDIKNKIKNTMKKINGELYSRGWPRRIEIKANVLHSLKSNKAIPFSIRNTITGDDLIAKIISSIKNACLPRIDYIAVNKKAFKSVSFKRTPYGIAYNYLAGKILVPLILKCKNCLLTVDKRNKETHNRKDFNGYIQFVTNCDALEKRINLTLDIEHGESHINYGLQAIDFFCWSVYRKIAFQDYRFFKLFSDLVVQGQEWYCT